MGNLLHSLLVVLSQFAEHRSYVYVCTYVRSCISPHTPLCSCLLTWFDPSGQTAYPFTPNSILPTFVCWKQAVVWHSDQSPLVFCQCHAPPYTWGTNPGLTPRLRPLLPPKGRSHLPPPPLSPHNGLYDNITIHDPPICTLITVSLSTSSEVSATLPSSLPLPRVSLGTHTYSRYAELSHLLSVLIRVSSTPTSAAVVAAPMRKLCPAYFN